MKKSSDQAHNLTKLQLFLLNITLEQIKTAFVFFFFFLFCFVFSFKIIFKKLINDSNIT